jgi:hypothetical protein
VRNILLSVPLLTELHVKLPIRTFLIIINNTLLSPLLSLPSFASSAAAAVVVVVVVVLLVVVMVVVVVVVVLVVF